MARPHASRVRAVNLVTFGRSYTSVWRVRATLLVRAHGRASARWPWHVRALALGALGPTSGKVMKPVPTAEFGAEVTGESERNERSATNLKGHCWSLCVRI
ncbi:hypothetical protein PIB30_048612 [Stylosanthes scabra]|uniref:Uncharacterized protein n=1 Tax=Stylosanthes scabra TaxID=79078 RepID=A0ABU6RH46_9FABA|nr:hypothetical protein [Stylosanthes scabra]